MIEKTTEVRREILKRLIQDHGGKGRDVLIKKVKEQGVYKSFVDDIEVWNLVKKFAEFHQLPLLDMTRKQIEELNKSLEENTKVLTSPDIKIKQEPEDEFLESLKKEHALLSKKLLALNKIIDVYEKNNQ